VVKYSQSVVILLRWIGIQAWLVI